MGQELMATYPLFAKTVMECQRVLIDQGYPGCLGVIAPDDKVDSHLPKEELAQSFQVGVFVIEIALARLFMSWGVTPTVVLGHRYTCPPKSIK